MFRKVLFGLSSTLLLGLVSSPMAMANTTSSGTARQAEQSLVALGDSITYGYNLNTNVIGDINNHHTSHDAFPYLIGSAENMRVRDLGVPGWTSTELLSALTSNEQFRTAVQHADVITIDIGSNDLLHVLAKDQLAPIGTLETDLNSAGTNLVGNTLPKILKGVRTLDPTARIVVYNIYNPLPADSPLQPVAGQFLPFLNGGIQADAAAAQASYADAYIGFSGHTSTYVLPNNVHPTVAGQQELALLGERALNSTVTP